MSEYFRKLLKSVEESEQAAYKELKLVTKENEKLKKEKQELLEALHKILKQCDYTPEEANCTILNHSIDTIMEIIEEILQKYEGDNDE